MSQLRGHVDYDEGPGYSTWPSCSTRGVGGPLCESLLATLEYELLDRVSDRTPVDARAVSFDFVEGWYNTQRRSLASSGPSRTEAAGCTVMPTAIGSAYSM